MAGERSDLGKIFITPGGDYDATVTYETLTMVKYNNSLYLTLRTVTGVTPSDDRVNYLLMAQGFTATRLESITATDVQGLVTEPGDEMPAQTLINAIADRVANQLVTNSALTDILGDYILKSAIANNLSITEEGKVLDARQGKALNDAFTTLNDAKQDALILVAFNSNVGVFENGGYLKIGRLVLFDLTFTCQASTTGSALISGFPASSQNNKPFYGQQITDSPSSNVLSFRIYGGNLYPNLSIGAGRYHCYGTYISAS